ncbi:PLP-dependent aminotransferase family protein [Myxococcus sp. RHSTA-1-4]|uniref:MocR-like pyridoxine biosynthesis transcription factor PdxR n=1 Tax=Myxococcus sp. RHSTA-1-4 TaxID=2874601 RepID=UPI001CBED8F6|nr:PLP-dependent aminotransferase family protein [Myxococcus sp. RHSTA-1-4]MBZ4418038.1 PLP-dependent aminotransferase family protein [Myxococcus sp. RHSTA-1-4]
MDLHVNLESRRDIAGQIYRELRAAILDGRLRRGERVPPTRELARRLSVSRNTVSVAYEWLTAEGLLAGRVRAGSYVQGEPPGAGGRPGSKSGVRLRARAVWSTLPDPRAAEVPAAYDFRVGIPDGQLFPFETWRRLMARQLRAATLPAAYAEAAGHPGLREAVARHVGVARGVRADAGDVIVTHGAQQALDLIGRVLLEPGDCVAVEEPGYPPARLLFQSLGARVVPVPVDTEGLDVGALPDDARLVYVTPSHQFPLGMPMSPARRTALLDWAKQRDAVVIEDDYDSEFRFGGRPLETLHGLDRSGRVIYVGSFSKVMLPALRLGFLIAPPSIQRELRLAKRVSDWHSQLPAQAALARFIDEGLLARHIRKMRREYESRHERILEKLTRHFGVWLRPLPSTAGLHLSAMFRAGGRRLEEDVVARAKEAGVGLISLSRYYASTPARAGLVLGYGSVPAARLDEGLRRLLACVSAAAGAKRP